jgi:hypothetical protein
MFGEVSEHYGGVRNVSESERNGSDHFWKVENHFRKVVLVIGRCGYRGGVALAALDRGN